MKMQPYVTGKTCELLAGLLHRTIQPEMPDIGMSYTKESVPFYYLDVKMKEHLMRAGTFSMDHPIAELRGVGINSNSPYSLSIYAKSRKLPVYVFYNTVYIITMVIHENAIILKMTSNEPGGKPKTVPGTDNIYYDMDNVGVLKNKCRV